MSSLDKEPVKPGRPRDPDVDRAVLAATLELLAQEGYAQLTMERVASRARVGKASLYRRWASKEALVLDAVSSNPERPSVPDTGSLRGDMLTYLQALVGYRKTHSQATYAISSEVSCNPALGAAFRANVLAPLLANLSVIVRRAVERGELPESTDVELLASVPAALLREHLLLTGRFPDELLVNRIVAQFFSSSGLTADTGALRPLGPPAGDPNEGEAAL